METPPMTPFSLPQSPSRSPPFFQKRLAHKQMFRRVKHYHQWLRSSIHLKTKLVRAPLILSGYKAFKEQALTSCIQSLLSKNAIERVENLNLSGFAFACFLYPSLTKVEASNRPKQAQHLPTCGKVLN